MRPLARYGADADARAQAAIERATLKDKTERLLHAVETDPTIETWALIERFGWTQDRISETLHRAGWRWNNSQWVRR